MFEKKMNSKLFNCFIVTSILIISFLFNISARLCSAINVATTGNTKYLVPDNQAFWLLCVYSLLIVGSVVLPKILRNDQLIPVYFKAGVFGCVLSILGAFYSDVFYLVEITKINNDYQGFVDTISIYLHQESWFYLFLCLLLIIIFALKQWLYNGMHETISSIRVKFYSVILALVTPLIVVYPLQVINIYLFEKLHSKQFIELPITLTFSQNSMYSMVSMLILLSAFNSRVRQKISIDWLKRLTNIVGIGLVLTVCLQIFFAIFPDTILSQRRGLHPWQTVVFAEDNMKDNAVKFLPILALILFAGAFRQLLKKMQFDDMTEPEQTSGNFGTARYAIKKDLEKLNAYHPANGPFIGVDDKRSLYLPMSNKLTISPPGGGKTTSSSIPILLTHDGPVFVFDIKGELWAVTARYRSQVLGRHVVAIDPFGVTKSDDFRRGKPESLLKEYHLNPFDWIPEDKKQRDRMMNAFAASFVINEGGFATHFDENAKILIRGYIDYLMNLDASERGLPMLYQLMSESIEEAQHTFDQMAQLDGRAGAAANQINRVGLDERGSILSTSYRQIDWMGDSNIQETLSSSNFDLRDFLKGNMDIFVILPSDQVKEHNRLFRMMMSLLMSMIVQANPSDLPKKKMLFLLEELAQLGASPDVEQCIEVMRIRGVIVWTVFQALKQIEMFTKPDLFLSVPLKQIFTNDDIQTMQWIQTLGGKKTVLTKTLSTNKGDSRQKMQAFGGSVSSGEGESVHETGVDLIQLNEIRELPKDEQFVFLHGTKPIRCKKVRYFEHADFLGKFDPNPLEEKH
jgi:type IV secretory pathway TraG/TraD family ATPase VirD4